MTSFLKKFHPLDVPGLVGRTGWAGTTDIASGDTEVVVTASQVQSGAGLMLGLGITTVASHRDMVVSINSVVDNTSFVVVADKATVDTQPVNYILIGR